MNIHNTVTQSNGVIIVVLQAQFVGAPSDATDKQKIAAFGDPLVNMAGRNLQDPNNPSFTFSFQTTELNVGITTQMQNYSARFLTALPTVPPPSSSNVNPPPNWFGVCQANEMRARTSNLAPLDCVVANEGQQNEAATAWVNIMVSRISAAMAILRGETIVPAIPDSTV